MATISTATAWSGPDGADRSLALAVLNTLREMLMPENRLRFINQATVIGLGFIAGALLPIMGG